MKVSFFMIVCVCVCVYVCVHVCVCARADTRVEGSVLNSIISWSFNIRWLIDTEKKIEKKTKYQLTNVTKTRICYHDP